MHGKTILIFSRIWNYDEASLLNTFDNQDGPNRGISKLFLVNELDESMLLVSSSKICFYYVFWIIVFKCSFPDVSANGRCLC